MTAIEWRSCTDRKCPCHSAESLGSPLTWTFDRVINQVMVDAVGLSGRSMPNTRAEQDLWEAIAERMETEMFGPLVHGCPWRIAREVFDARFKAPGEPVHSSDVAKEPLRVVGFPVERRRPKAA